MYIFIVMIRNIVARLTFICTSCHIPFNIIQHMKIVHLSLCVRNSSSSNKSAQSL